MCFNILHSKLIPPPPWIRGGMAAICHTAARGGWAFECPFVRLGVGLARLCHATSRGGLGVLVGAHGLGVGLGKLVRVGLGQLQMDLQGWGEHGKFDGLLLSHGGVGERLSCGPAGGLQIRTTSICTGGGDGSRLSCA